MKISVMLLTLSSLISLSGCGRTNNSAHSSAHIRLSQNIQERKFTPPSDWKQAKSCGVIFYLPSDLREKKVQGKDTCLGQFQNDYMSLKLEVLNSTLDENGRSEYADNRECELKNLLIDGRSAEVAYCSDGCAPKSVILFVPNMGDGRGLTIRTYSRSMRWEHISGIILKSVKFADSGAPNNSFNASGDCVAFIRRAWL
jgi:hypothetical protein